MSNPLSTIVDYVSQNAAAIGLLVGLLTPYVVAVIEQPSWSRRTRQVIAVVTSIVLGFITAVTAGDLADAGNVLLVIAVTFAASEASYQKLWKPTGIVPALESRTSSGRHAAPSN